MQENIPEFHIVLVEPEIPPNTGNVIRLCANTGARLHLVGPLGFPIDHSKMKRAGLDYHELTMFETYTSWDDFLTQSAPEPSRAFALTTKGTRRPDQVSFQKGDWLIFGSETKGLGEKLAWFDDSQRLRLAMRPGNRSMNLSNAVAVTAYEAWRQLGFCGSN
jgi:tRNA (cytidine/uridine-2'-O-)-methyltransferase